ncbi:MAG TPA: response regulator [Bacteroidota bacterium]|jgi:DNA-binding NtrC family response regulator|nr:response regulator [Bacteroidota bacterium]
MSTSTINILFIEDDAEYVSITKHFLRSFQEHTFDVTWASDEETAFEHLSGNLRFDIALLDYYLPSTNGLEILRRMYETKTNLPTILLTAHKDFRIAVEAMKYGVEEYIVKDEAIDTVLPRTIVSVLERVRLKRRIAEAEKNKMIAQRRADGVQELIVTMCHEFNNPLAAIKISSDIMLRQPSRDDEKALLMRLNENINALEKQIVKLRDVGADKPAANS